MRGNAPAKGMMKKRKIAVPPDCYASYSANVNESSIR
jgi:hypothetical protein